MKVLIVSNLYQPNSLGGAEKVAQATAEAFVARGHQVAVATLNPRGVYERGEVNGVRVHYLTVKNLYFTVGENGHPAAVKAVWHGLDSYNPFMGAPLVRILDREQPDVVNTHNIQGFSVSAWKAIKSLGVPLVHTVHDHYLLCARSGMFRGGRNCPGPCAACAIYSYPRKRLSHLVDVATGPSRFILERHIRAGCFSADGVVAVYNSCSIALSRGGKKECVDNPHVRFGFLGRIHPSKGIDLLIRTFLDLPPGKAELVIAGTGESQYEKQLKTMGNGRPCIRWLGFASPDALFGQVDVLVVPSVAHDSAPLVVLESLAHGVPVIGSCRGGIPELMGEGTGWVFDPDEPGALTRAVRGAIDLRDELAAMGERARARAAQFSTDAMVNGYFKAYSRAIERNRKNRKAA